MDKTKRFRRHVILAVGAIKEMLDNHQTNGDTTNDMALHFGISRNVLQDGFKQLYGLSIREYKLKQRMALSLELLEAGKDVKEVAIVLHYATPSAFTSAFKKFYGMTPTESFNGYYKSNVIENVQNSKK